MKIPSALITLSAVALLLLPSCVVPEHYAGSGYYTDTSLSTLPCGYRTVHVSGVPYYYYENNWYRRSGDRYINCSRPYGYKGSIGRHYHNNHEVTRLPYGYRTTIISGTRYYNHGNNWYRRSGNRYASCPKPHGHSGNYLNHHRTHNHTRYTHNNRRTSDSRYSNRSNHQRSCHTTSNARKNSEPREHREHPRPLHPLKKLHRMIHSR